jgi:hypothetical protein
VARNPTKLKDLLSERGVYDSAIANNLTIVQGSVSDTNAVKQVLVYKEEPVDIIINGIGGKLIFDGPLKPTLDNPTVCQDGMRTILEVSRTLNQARDGDDKKPLLVVLSTTGISEKRDLPFLMMPMYKWMLKVPHVDKKAMEDLIFQEIATDKAARGIREYIIIRPSFLTDGKGNGLTNIKVGAEDKPAVGYVISRNEVGAWLFQNSVRHGLREENPYLGKIVTITT